MRKAFSCPSCLEKLIPGIHCLEQKKMIKHKHAFLYTGFNTFQVLWSPKDHYPQKTHEFGYVYEFEYFVQTDMRSGSVRMQGGAAT